MISLFDAKKNTDKRMNTQYTTERKTSLTEERTLLDKEEQTDVTNHTLEEKDKYIPKKEEKKPP